jgi:hypothetical protein
MNPGERRVFKQFFDEETGALVMDSFEIEEDGHRTLVVRTYVPLKAREYILESDDWSTDVIDALVAKIDAGEGADLKVNLT